jgi:hypothetical protein
MDAAQQVHSIGEVPTRMATGRFKQRVQVGVANATFARNACELGLGNTDLMVADGPVDCHSSPLVHVSGEALQPPS